MFVKIPALKKNAWWIDADQVYSMYWNSEDNTMTIKFKGGPEKGSIIYDVRTERDARKIMEDIESARSHY